MGTQETKVYIAILIAAAVIAVILIYFSIAIFRQQKQNLALHLAKVKAEIITLEKERLRMSRDMHDELAPLLLRIKYNVGSFDLKASEDVTLQDQSNDLLDEVIDRVREISHDLVPALLERKGLKAALEDLTGLASQRYGLQIQLHYPSNLQELSHEKSVHLFRIVQEILHNTIKHAQAKNLNIEIKTEGPVFYLLSEDNGKGFDYRLETKKPSGIGLRSLLNRTDILGGKMYLDSKAYKGTRYIIEIPVNSLL